MYHNSLFVYNNSWDTSSFHFLFEFYSLFMTSEPQRKEGARGRVKFCFVSCCHYTSLLPLALLQTFMQAWRKHQEWPGTSAPEGQDRSEERHRNRRWDSQATPVRTACGLPAELLWLGRSRRKVTTALLSYFLLFALFFKVLTSCRYPINVLFMAASVHFLLPSHSVHFLLLPCFLLPAYFPLCYLLHFL